MAAFVSDMRPANSDRPVALWLLLLCAMVFVMVVLGGATRLTGSGLSIVEWRPVTGILPPLSAAAWEEAFAAYRASPEFRAVNFWMTVADFKSIYWLEYLHRLWGRLIGVAFLLPLAYFLARGVIRRADRARFAMLFALGVLQGGIGWAMVASGLVERPSVSHYRLAVHLGLAAAIYGWMLWLALTLLAPRAAGPRPRAARTLTAATIGLVVLTLLWGAFVAGLRAGAIYNSFPLMGGGLAPPEFWTLAPWPINLVENPAAVQFIHRLLATATLAAALILWATCRGIPLAPGARTALGLFAGAIIVQYALGIATLLSHVALPLGVLHQAGAFVVLAFGLCLARRLCA